MTDIDKELEQLQDAVLNAIDYAANTGDHAAGCDTIIELIKNHDLDLLSRIKEEGPDTHRPELYSDFKSQEQAKGFNQSNDAWRTAIDNIAKEIRGEGHE